MSVYDGPTGRTEVYASYHYFNLISEACCHAKFMSDTHFSPVQIMNLQCAYNGD